MKSVDALRELVKRDGLILEGEEFDKCLDAIEEEGRAIYAGAHSDGAALAFELTKLAYKGDDERYQFCRRVELAANDRADVTLFGVDYTALPLDADGVPIHVEDVMEWDNGTFIVHELKVTEDGWTTWDEQHGYTVHTDETHHHAPTVEDVLREMLDEHHRWSDGESERTIGEMVADYASRLRLKED